MTTLKKLKAKLIRLNSTHRQKLTLDTGEQDKMIDENPSLHHLIKARKRQASRTIKKISDDQGIMYTESFDIMKVFTIRFCKKFSPIHMDGESASLLMNCELQKITQEMNAVLEDPITIDELRNSISKSKSQKAPGHDGIGLRFYKTAWEEMKHDLLQILNCMYIDGIILARQLRGLMVCIPKHAHPSKVDDYRPLTLMNTDYKILTRIIVKRLKPILSTLLHLHQYTGIGGNSVFDAVAAIRDVIAYAKVTRKPMCMVSIDFNAAFDKISHEYLQEILGAHGFNVTFIQRIMRLYETASSEIQINGFRSNLILIKSSIRRGCPLSMLLFVMCLNRLIQSLEKNLSGVKIGRQKAPTSVVAYADNVTMFLTSVADIQKMKETLLAYETTTVVRINLQKSRVLALGTWDTTRQIMNIPYHKDIKILGFQFTDIVNLTAIAVWSSVTARVRATAQETYFRDLSMDRRIQFVHKYLLAKIWYVTQIFPPLPDCIRHINTTISWFIWQGEIFRVPLSTL